MNLRDAYNRMQDACGIEVGDTVQVLRTAKTNEMGWGQNWVTTMDKRVGECGVVRYPATSDLGVSVIFDDGIGAYFPFFVLKLVEKKKKIYAAEISEHRTIYIVGNFIKLENNEAAEGRAIAWVVQLYEFMRTTGLAGVRVGCATFIFGDVERAYELIQRYQRENGAGAQR